jgi:NAD(P)-dependent dehydrogenase (short-subunit alcohol dehydrogenase family)
MVSSGVDFVSTIHHDTYPAISPTTADLSDKVVVIAGASKGIGRATALSYAKAGASGIVVLARSDLSSLKSELASAAKSANRKEPEVLSVKVDTTDRVTVESAAKEVERVFGHVDILINNAAYLEAPKPIADTDPDSWWQTWEVNVKGSEWPLCPDLRLASEKVGRCGKTRAELSLCGRQHT